MQKTNRECPKKNFVRENPHHAPRQMINGRPLKAFHPMVVLFSMVLCEALQQMSTEATKAQPKKEQNWFSKSPVHKINWTCQLLSNYQNSFTNDLMLFCKQKVGFCVFCRKFNHDEQDC